MRFSLVFFVWLFHFYTGLPPAHAADVLTETLALPASGFRPMATPEKLRDSNANRSRHSLGSMTLEACLKNQEKMDAFLRGEITPDNENLMNQLLWVSRKYLRQFRGLRDVPPEEPLNEAVLRILKDNRYEGLSMPGAYIGRMIFLIVQEMSRVQKHPLRGTSDSLLEAKDVPSNQRGLDEDLMLRQMGEHLRICFNMLRTDEEREIILWLADGRTLAEYARSKGREPSYYRLKKYYIARLFREKLQLLSRSA